MKKNLLFLLLAILFGISALLFTLFYREAKQEAIDNLNLQQSLHARQAAQGIEEFFSHWIGTLTILSKSRHIIDLDQTGKEEIANLYVANRKQIRGVTRVDAAGRIAYTIPFNNHLIGRDISYQKHVQEVMRTRKPAISDVFTAVQGYQTVALHIPVFERGVYRGTIAITIDFHSLAKRYLEVIQIGRTGYAWVTSRDGTELYCPVPGHTGNSVFKNCEKFPSILAMAGEMLKGHQGTTTYTYDMIGERSVKPIRKHAVYMPIALGDTFWSIVVATSEEEVLASLAAFRIRLMLLIFLFLLGILLFAYYGLKAWLITQEEEKRRRAEAALMESEERFRKAFYTSPDSVNINRLSDGLYVSINEGFTRMTGYTEEDVIGKTSVELNIWANLEEREKLVDGLKKEGGVRNLDATFRKKHGELLYGLMSAAVIDLQGVPHLLSITRDITDRKQAEEALRESEERISRLANEQRVVLNGMPIGVSFLKQRTVQYANPAFDAIFGHEMGATKGRHTSEFYAEHETFERIGIDGYAAIAGGGIYSTEALMKRRDGSNFHCRLTGQAVSPGRPEEGSVWMFQDVTDYRRAEEARRESEENYRILIENANEAIFVAQEGKLVFSNPMTEKVVGRPREDLLSRPFVEFIHPDDRGMVIDRHVRRMRGEKLPHVYSFRIARGNDSFIWVELNTVVVNWKEKPATLNFLSDITERRRAEEENRALVERLQRAEKMEALGQLAGGVAHDLNNVLGALTGYSELLLMGIPEGHRSRGHAEKILQSTEKGAEIIQDLLTMARRGVTASDVLNLNGVVADFLKTPVFEKLKDYHPRVTFRTELDPNLLNVKGSAVHLEKTLMNLVSNAVESISGGGEVTIRTQGRYLDRPLKGYDEVKEGDYAVLIVSDTGAGIPLESREKIFEPFYTKKAMGRSGTGLGLAIVWGTVKDHSGYIDLQSEEGAGTAFTLYFPVTREEVTAQQQKEPIERYMGKGESVLVVDDIAEQRDVAAKLLTTLGYRVHTVSGGEEAVEYLKGNRADILVLDMIMAPGIDGLETYKRIMEIHPGQKAIIVSGFSETGRVKEAQRLGAGAYVKKPYILEKIGMAVRGELDR